VGGWHRRAPQSVIIMGQGEIHDNKSLTSAEKLINIKKNGKSYLLYLGYLLMPGHEVKLLFSIFASA
jgi:hypothetical protein